MACLLITLILVAGCEAFDGGYTKIVDVLKNPSQFDGKDVKVEGRVMDVLKLPLIETKFYVIKDETGELLVMSDTSPPGMGAEVWVGCLINSMVIIGDKALGLHLMEFRRW